MKHNPYSVRSQRYDDWQDGYKAGWNEAVALIERTNRNVRDNASFRALILAVFAENKGNCSKINSCPKIAILQDKDMLESQFVAEVRGVCDKCAERK